jgi:Putative adhesin
VLASARRSHLSPWARLVTVATVIVVVGLVALLTAGLATSRQRVVTFAVAGELDGVTLDLGEANVDVVNGGQDTIVRVERRDRFSFGHSARIRRSVEDGMLRLSSRCPSTVLHACAVSYRVTMPDNVPVDVRTGSGNVRLASYQGSARISTNDGDISIAGFCGFSLQARTESGNVRAGTSCPPPQMSLRSTSGAVHAVVPSDRYQVDAASASGHLTVQGIQQVSDAPFTIEVLSSSGDVTVEGRGG